MYVFYLDERITKQQQVLLCVLIGVTKQGLSPPSPRSDGSCLRFHPETIPALLVLPSSTRIELCLPTLLGALTS